MALKRSEIQDFIIQLTLETGSTINRYWDSTFAVEYKPDNSPVTTADKEVEETLRRRIKERFPDHGIIGEEMGNELPDAEYVWVLDPIDGTKSFMTHVPLFGTLIGVLHEGKPIVGAIHQPVLNELCLGDGERTTINGRTVRGRDIQSLQEATLLTSAFETLLDNEKSAPWNRLVKECRLTRTWGDCYGYLLLASAKADIMVDPILNPWDLLPLIPIMEGAGLKITDWKGENAVQGESAVAAMPAIHDKVMKILHG